MDSARGNISPARSGGDEIDRLKTLLFHPEALQLSTLESRVGALDERVGSPGRLEKATAEVAASASNGAGRRSHATSAFATSHAGTSATAHHARSWTPHRRSTAHSTIAATKTGSAVRASSADQSASTSRRVARAAASAKVFRSGGVCIFQGNMKMASLLCGVRSGCDAVVWHRHPVCGASGHPARLGWRVSWLLRADRAGCPLATQAGSLCHMLRLGTLSLEMRMDQWL